MSNVTTVPFFFFLQNCLPNVPGHKSLICINNRKSSLLIYDNEVRQGEKLSILFSVYLNDIEHLFTQSRLKYRYRDTPSPFIIW